MGKRKSRKMKAPAPKKPKLETAFDCPFCNNRASVLCSINLKDRIATARCEVCKDFYSTHAHALTEPIDVYSDWIDACELVNQGINDVHGRGAAAAADDF